MRLVDLLLVLLFEGRTALPKSNIGTTTRTMSGIRRLDSAGERSHRHLIDCIRSKDTDALIDAIDTGGKGTSDGVTAQKPFDLPKSRVRFHPAFLHSKMFRLNKFLHTEL